MPCAQKHAPPALCSVSMDEVKLSDHQDADKFMAVFAGAESAFSPFEHQVRKMKVKSQNERDESIRIFTHSCKPLQMYILQFNCKTR